ncbi:MAG: hypothetical protein ABIJ97_10135 [Bacteroidota bacterium]
MKIKEFLKSHPFISVHAIERTMNIPTGTIRITTDRAIPEKYKDKIISLLKDYGWENNDVLIFDKLNDKTIANDHSIAVSNTKYFIKRDGKKCVVSYKDDYIRLADIPDMTKVIILDEIVEL